MEEIGEFDRNNALILFGCITKETDRDIDQIKQACMELHNFPRLRKIHWVGKYGNKFTDFFGEIEHIDTIEEIQLPLGTHNFVVSPYNPLIKLKSLIIPSDYITPQHPIWSGESKANLLSLCISVRPFLPIEEFQSKRIHVAKWIESSQDYRWLR